MQFERRLINPSQIIIYFSGSQTFSSHDPLLKTNFQDSHNFTCTCKDLEKSAVNTKQICKMLFYSKFQFLDFKIKEVSKSLNRSVCVKDMLVSCRSI